MTVKTAIFLFFFFFTFISCICHADGDDLLCQEELQKAINSCDGACSQAAQFDKYDYRKGLNKALQSKSGLKKFILYTERSTIMGAGADEQGCHLHALLLKWGDEIFATTVASVGKKASIRVVGLLDYVAVPEFSKRFPRTYNLVTEHGE
jgi:hypothetical protein